MKTHSRPLRRMVFAFAQERSLCCMIRNPLILCPVSWHVKNVSESIEAGRSSFQDRGYMDDSSGRFFSQTV